MLGLRGPLEFIKLNQVRIYGSVLVARAAQSFHYGKCASEDMGVVSRVERAERGRLRAATKIGRARRLGRLQPQFLPPSPKVPWSRACAGADAMAAS